MGTRIEIPETHAIITDPRYRRAAQLFLALNNREDPETGKIWRPHAGQALVGQKFFTEGKRRGMVICGRKWGKSDCAVDLCWRFGNLINKGQIYYFAAEANAVREIVWASGRLPDWGPKDYIAGTDKTQMRVTFTSGTFVKCDGADNFRGKKGFNPDVVILDEAADYPDSFWRAMAPNFASKDCIVLIISSPPWRFEEEPGKPTLFMRMIELYQKNPRYFYLNRTTFDNEANLPPGFLQNEERDMRETGEEDVWEREYLAKFTLNSGSRIIPTFNKKIHQISYEKTLEKIRMSPVDWDMVTAIDPGQVWAANLIAINQYTKEVLWIDEVYEKKSENQMVEKFWPRIREKQVEALGDPDPNRWINVYDEAERWFGTEATNRFSDPADINYCQVIPTEKQMDDKLDGLSMLRTIFAYGKGYMSERCKWTTWETENYRKTDKGDIPKKNDHTLDNSRYALHSVEYYISAADRPAEQKVPEFYKREPALEEDIQELLDDSGDSMQNVMDYIAGES